MTRLSISLIAASLLMLGSFQTRAHNDPSDLDVELHVNESYSNCYIDLHTNLTQAQFDRFSREAGEVVYYRSLTGLPLRKGQLEISMNQFNAPVDQTSDAWNNTFSHPEHDHWLGDKIALPNFSFKYGLTDEIQIGTYFTKDPNANYGFIGVDAQWSPERLRWKEIQPMFRSHYTTMLFVPDMNLHNAALEASAGRTFYNIITPYAGVALSGNAGVALSEEINVENTFAFSPRAMAGVSADWRFLHGAVQVDAGYIMSYSFSVGVRLFGKESA